MFRDELTEQQRKQLRILNLLDISRQLVFDHYGEENFEDTLADVVEAISRIICRVLRGEDG